MTSSCAITLLITLSSPLTCRWSIVIWRLVTCSLTITSYAKWPISGCPAVCGTRPVKCTNRGSRYVSSIFAFFHGHHLSSVTLIVIKRTPPFTFRDLGCVAHPLDGSRVARTERLYSKVRRLVLRRPCLGNSHFRYILHTCLITVN